MSKKYTKVQAFHNFVIIDFTDLAIEVDTKSLNNKTRYINLFAAH